MTQITGTVNDISGVLEMLEGKYDKAGGLITGDVSIDGNLTLIDTQWNDLRFPFMGRNIDTTSGRIDYNYDELGVDFATNSRFATTEQISMIAQFGHDWETGSVISPHLHWYQSAAAMPNFMIQYRWTENGAIVSPNWTMVKYGSNTFTYASGTLQQITEFDISVPAEIDTVSAILDIKFFRDTGNDSGLFAGSDPLAAVALTKEFDIHYQINSLGSDSEYIK